MPPAQSLRVRSGEVGLAVRVWPRPERPTVVLVHGYPDSQQVWVPVAERLAERYQVVTYDVRGAGESDAPPRTADYRLDKLAGDLKAVTDAVCPQQAFHLAAHDWGSIQSWESVTDAGTQSRIASYTTISGPCLDHVGFWIRRRLLHPTPKNLVQLLGQLLHSWYIYVFHLPWIAPLLWKYVLASRWPALLKRIEGVEAEPSATRARDGYHGIKLYRANIFQRLFMPRERHASMPVQVIVPLEDHYVRPQLADDLSLWVPRLWRRDIAAGHWSLLLQQPERLAGYIAEFVDGVESGQVPEALKAARNCA